MFYLIEMMPEQLLDSLWVADGDFIMGQSNEVPSITRLEKLEHEYLETITMLFV